MNAIYNDLLTILDYAQTKADGIPSELPAGISPENIRYIRSIVEGALNAGALNGGAKVG